MKKFLSDQAVCVYTLAFLLMIFSSAALYWSAEFPDNPWMYVLMFFFISGNLLVLFTKK